jgi:hypothetical protein
VYTGLVSGKAAPVSRYEAATAYRWVELNFRVFLISALNETAPFALNPRTEQLVPTTYETVYHHNCPDVTVKKKIPCFYRKSNHGLLIPLQSLLFFFYCLVCEAIGTAATPGLLCQPRVIVKIIVEKPIECRLTRETEVLGENLPQRHFCPSQNPTWPDPVLKPGRRGGKPAPNHLSYGAAISSHYVNYLGSYQVHYDK